MGWLIKDCGKDSLAYILRQTIKRLIIMALIPPHFIDTVVAIGTIIETNTHWVGTGFLFGKMVEETDDKLNKYSVYLVTNKHVLKDLSVILVRFNPQTDQSAKDYPVVLTNPATRKQVWTGHPDNEIDVAVIPVNFKHVKDEGMKCAFFESDKHTATVDELMKRETTEGDFVYVLGFPMGLVSKDRQHVFVRSGVISRIRDLFEKRGKDFVIDAPVFPGNSGGPVISKPEITSIQGTKSSNQSSLIGIVKSYIPFIDVAISQQTKRPRITFEENSGLTKIEPVDHILQTIAEAEKVNVP